MSIAAGAALKAASGIMRGVTTGLSTAASQAKYIGAGQRANAVSAAAQAAAGNFNQASADNANAINSQTIANQYGFNSGQAQLANQFSQASWEQAANYNTEMFERAMQFNAEQAQLNRDWQERIESTKYQRATKDMKAAGLNPVLAATGGGISIGSGGGGAATIASPSMSGMHGESASGGLLGANDASISGYTGQMEYYAGLMGLLSSGLGGLSSAFKSFAEMPGNVIKGTGELLQSFIEGNSNGKILGVDMSDNAKKQAKEDKKNGVKYTYTNNGLFHSNNKKY